MIASYILSRTLVPTLAMYWIKRHQKASNQGQSRKTFHLFVWFSRFHHWFENRFDRFREGYRDLLSFGLRNAGKLVAIVLGFTVLIMVLFPFLGQDFFPSVDAGAFDMHVRMKAGTRIEETARSVDQIEQMIRQVIPANQLQGIVDNLGIPYSGINTSYNKTGTMSAADGDILVSLNQNHDLTNKFIEGIRRRMPHDFVGIGFWFPPADMVAQILNFGLPAPIDVQIIGANQEADFQFANNLMNQIRQIPGAVDFRIQEPNNAPELDITMDRTKASILGINAQSVAKIYSRNAGTLEVQQLTDKAARTKVHVVHPIEASEAISLQLPGQTMPYTDAPIFAQTSGYLKKWYFDIGAEVKAGAVLAEIDTPEVDAQLAQAQAQLKVAQATNDLSKVTYQRFQDLFQRNVIAAQDFDTAAENYGQNKVLSSQNKLT
jgi:multidrug efflux pump subunit AcrB